MNITLSQAEKMIAAAKVKAAAIGVDMNIAIVDDGANIKAFARMDNAITGSADIAIRKARTASLLRQESGNIGKQSQPGGPLYNIELTNGGLVTFPGGIPLKNGEGKVVGAIGVSGGEVEEDYAVAAAGAAAFEEKPV
jgi:uncharacterized protein GlcG (DUF336 family)